jgi:hypothetical protein
VSNAVSSSGFNPIENPEASHVFYISGISSPGCIPVDGIHGFERETGWDIKQGKGTQGATLTLKTMPPTKGSIALQFWLPEHFDLWSSFVRLLKYSPAKKTKDAADAVDIWHPSFVDINLTQVVTEKVSPWRHVGKGLYIVTVDFIEWQNPPPVSIVSTTNAARPDSKGDTPGSPPDPVGDAQQKLIGQLLDQASKP